MSLRPASLASLLLFAACTGGAPLGPKYSKPAPAPAREPLVLAAEPATSAGLGALRLYGRDGALARDLAGAAGLGPEWVELRVSAGGKTLVQQAPYPSSRFNLFQRTEVPGLQTSIPAAQVLVRAKHRSEEKVRVVGLAPEGTKVFDVTLDGGWDWFQLSSTGRYLFGDNGADRGLVFDTEQAQVVWTGALRIGIFASDDSAFYSTSRDAAPEVVRQPLPAGAPTRHPLPPGIPGTGMVLLWPVAASPSGVVYRTAGNISFGEFLLLLAPGGQWRAFDPRLERFSVEDLVGFIEDGTAVLYTRAASYGQTTAAPLGLFRLELESGASTKVEVPLGRFAAGSLFGMNEGAITRWTLENPAPETLATVGPLEDGWTRGLGAISDDGSVLVAEAYWFWNRMPDSYPEDGVLVLDASGERLRFPPGYGALDRSGRLYALRPDVERTSSRLAIGDVETGRASWVETSAPFAIVYASP